MVSSIQKGNPYRAVLRRDYPEPLIALLAFILGIWLWDHYFGKVQGYPPGTETVALVKIDRELRLADAMAGDPAWLKWAMGVDSPVVVRRDSLQALGKLAKDNSMTASGLEAFAVIRAVQDQLPFSQAVASFTQGQATSDLERATGEFSSHRGTWWLEKRMKAEAPPSADELAAIDVFTADSALLRTRAVVARSLVWLVGLLGLAFVPVALKRLKAGLHAPKKGYGGAWTMRLGLVVFLVTTLAWIGFNLTLELGVGSLPQLHPLVALVVDSAARLLPTLIALGLLFRRPRHAVRVMGLDKKPDIAVVFGTFSLLLIFDEVLRRVMATGLSGDPGGGLSLTDSGLWGLVFAIVASCLLAPVAEEILYRGVLFRSIGNRVGIAAGAVISSLVFASLHFYDGYGLVSVAVFGMCCALTYSATGALTSAIALHMLYNLSIKLPEWIVYHAPLG